MAECSQQIQTWVDWLGKVGATGSQQLVCQSVHQGQGLRETKGKQCLQVQRFRGCTNRVFLAKSLKGCQSCQYCECRLVLCLALSFLHSMVTRHLESLTRSGLTQF